MGRPLCFLFYFTRSSLMFLVISCCGLVCLYTVMIITHSSQTGELEKSDNLIDVNTRIMRKSYQNFHHDGFNLLPLTSNSHATSRRWNLQDFRQVPGALLVIKRQINSLTIENRAKWLKEQSGRKIPLVSTQFAATISTSKNDGMIDKEQKKLQKRLPQAIIIGVKKCGTRALLEFLKLHPDIQAAGPEIHFFDKNYGKGLDWYRYQMPLSLKQQITIEKTPSYFVTREVPERIYSMSPTIKLLLVVRDPVTRVISDYTQFLTKHPRNSTPAFEKLAFFNSTTGLVNTDWNAIRIGMYSRFLKEWYRFFSPSQIHVISGENLIKDPADEIARVQKFLQVKNVVSHRHFYFNETKGFPCLKKSEGSPIPHCLGRTKGRTHPDIHPSTLLRLKEFYRPFNLQFYQMVGRDFGWS